MDDPQERRLPGLRIRIDRALCVGFADCIEVAPQAFALDGEGVVVFAAPETASGETLIAACDACPVDALTAWDEQGRQLAPTPRPKAKR